MVLDIDNIKESEVNALFEKIIEIKTTMMAFISPSGNGIKIIVKTDNEVVENHKNAYGEVVDFYKEALKSKKEVFKFDEKTCDVSRLCFISYDENAYLNLNAETFLISENEITATLKKIERRAEGSEFSLKMMITIDFTKKMQPFERENRNNFLNLLGSNCYSYALEIENVISYCIEVFTDEDFTKEEIEMTIRRAYELKKDKKEVFGKWKSSLEKKVSQYRKETKNRRMFQKMILKIILLPI